MLDLYSRIEEPMIDTLADMETAGVRIDTRSLAEYSVELGELLSRLERADTRSGRRAGAQHQLDTPARRGALRQDAHYGQAEDDAHQAVLDRGGVPARLRPRTRDRAQGARIPRREEAAVDLCRCSARAGQSPHRAHSYIIQSGRDGHRQVVVDQPPTCKTYLSATLLASPYAQPSSPPMRIICCCRPITRRSSCGSWRI